MPHDTVLINIHALTNENYISFMYEICVITSKLNFIRMRTCVWAMQRLSVFLSPQSVNRASN